MKLYFIYIDLPYRYVEFLNLKVKYRKVPIVATSRK